jgi:MinD-like ATPase involved in chromosome partitioning or flagellar assembly
VTPNEHDNPTTAHEPEDGAEHADASDDQYGEHLTSGTDPGAPAASAYPSEYPHATGPFPRLQPREFPHDESPADESPRDDAAPDEVARDEAGRDEFPPEAASGLPVMEQLPDPDVLPDPGYPAMTGYQSAASPFPPSAIPEAEASWPFEPATEQRPAFRPPQYRHAEPYQAEPPEPYLAHPSELYQAEPTELHQAEPPGPYQAEPPGPYQAEPPEPYLAQPADAYAGQPADGYGEWPAEDHDQLGDSYLSRSQDPYLAPRSSAEAPPLPGSAGSLSDILGGARPEEAPPFSATQSDFPAAAPAFPAAAAGEPLSAPPSFSEPDTAEPLPKQTAETLTADVLLHGKRAVPGVGWRRTVYKATGGLVHIDESAAYRRRRDLINRVRTPVAGGHHRVAVMSLKGGVGKTTAAVGLGSTLASLRGDRVIAVDGNPDRGTLSDKVRLETPATIRDLLNERAQVSRYADVRAFTSQASSRLEILASDRDPGVSVAFSADDYRSVVRVLEHYYSICITDCGTGLLHSAMTGILELADQIVLVSSPSVDGARSASATLDWLEAHSYGDLVRNGVVVLSMVRRKSKSTVDLDRLEQHFAARCRAVVRVPYDPHLEEGAEVELEMLNSDTANAYLTLAALVGDGFAVQRHQVSRVP